MEAWTDNHTRVQGEALTDFLDLDPFGELGEKPVRSHRALRERRARMIYTCCEQNAVADWGMDLISVSLSGEVIEPLNDH